MPTIRANARRSTVSYVTRSRPNAPASLAPRSQPYDFAGERIMARKSCRISRVLDEDHRSRGSGRSPAVGSCPRRPPRSRPSAGQCHRAVRLQFFLKKNWKFLTPTAVEGSGAKIRKSGLGALTTSKTCGILKNRRPHNHFPYRVRGVITDVRRSRNPLPAAGRQTRPDQLGTTRQGLVPYLLQANEFGDGGLPKSVPSVPFCATIRASFPPL